MVPQARLIDLRHGDAASPAWGSLEHLPPTHRALAVESASIRGRVLVQCHLVTCWLCDIGLGLSNFQLPRPSVEMVKERLHRSVTRRN